MFDVKFYDQIASFILESVDDIKLIQYIKK